MTEDLGFGNKHAEWRFVPPTHLTIVLGMMGFANRGVGDWRTMIRVLGCRWEAGGKVCQVGRSEMQSLRWWLAAGGTGLRAIGRKLLVPLPELWRNICHQTFVRLDQLVFRRVRIGIPRETAF